MTFCGELESAKNSVFSDFYCLANELALVGLRPGLSSAVPPGLGLETEFSRRGKTGCGKRWWQMKRSQSTWLVTPIHDWAGRTKTRTQKTRGRFLLRDLALSVPIFGDPVRLPDHNFGSPRITRHSRTHARAFLALLRSLSPQELSRRHPFPVAWPSLVADSRR
jgi:hypothetical protein